MMRFIISLIGHRVVQFYLSRNRRITHYLTKKLGTCNAVQTNNKRLDCSQSHIKVYKRELLKIVSGYQINGHESYSFCM